MIRVLVCGLMGGARLIELAWSRRNLASSGPTSEGRWSRATYPGVVALHVAVIGGTAVFGRRNSRRPWLVLLLAVQPVRAWVLLTLGQRWNTRAAVPATMQVATGGPYRHVRHPNYSVVAVELAALPLAFGLPRLAIAASLANALLLGPRIREEERALDRLPGYRAHFARKPRFIPGVL